MVYKHDLQYSTCGSRSTEEAFKIRKNVFKQEIATLVYESSTVFVSKPTVNFYLRCAITVGWLVWQNIFIFLDTLNKKPFKPEPAS